MEKKERLLNKWCWYNWLSTYKRIQKEYKYLLPYTKGNFSRKNGCYNYVSAYYHDNYLFNTRLAYLSSIRILNDENQSVVSEKDEDYLGDLPFYLYYMILELFNGKKVLKKL